MSSAPQSAHTDEDWSIISSSSDVDDDQSTTSSHDYKLDHQIDPLHMAGQETNSQHEEAQRDESRSSISSFATFRLPSIYSRSNSSSTPKQEVPIDPRTDSTTPVTPETLSAVADLAESTADDNYAASVSSYSEETNSSESGDDHEVTASTSGRRSNSTSSQDSDISHKIKFYENLTRINDSIKQSSTNFFSNYAKLKIDQLNRYIDQQASMVKNEDSEIKSETVGNDNSGEENLDDTIVDLKDEAEESLGKVSSRSKDNKHHSNVHFDGKTSEDAANGSSSTTDNATFPPIENDHVAEKSTINRILVYALQHLSDFLEAHSDYLYYYFIIFGVISMIPVYYGTIYMLTPAEVKPEPVNPLAYVQQVWQDYLYEEETSPASTFITFSLFSKKRKRVNRVLKLSNQFKNNVIQGSTQVFHKYGSPVWGKWHEIAENPTRVLKERSFSLASKLSKIGSEARSAGRVHFKKVLHDTSRYSRIAFDKWRGARVEIMDKFGVFGSEGASKLSEYSQIAFHHLKQYSHVGVQQFNEFKQHRFKKLLSESEILINQAKDEALLLNEYSKAGMENVREFVDTNIHKYDSKLSQVATAVYRGYKSFSRNSVEYLNTAADVGASKIQKLSLKENLNKCAIAIYKQSRPIRDLFKTTTKELTVVQR